MTDYANEAALCAAFIEWAKREGWTPYAETAGWDLLLVGSDGTQIGVQAKMRFNMKVLLQSIPDRWQIEWHDEGPDFRTILLPKRDGAAETICGALGLTIFAPSSHWKDPSFTPGISERSAYYDHWHWWAPLKRCELPAYVPDVVAGASGPVQLTKWKIAALKVCALLEIRGHVTRQDFKRIGIDHRRWVGPGGWLDLKDGVYVRTPQLTFDRQHPTVYQQVLADVRKEFADLITSAAPRAPIQGELS